MTKEKDDDRRYVIVMSGRNPNPVKGINRAQRRAQVVIGGPPVENPFTLKREEVGPAVESFIKQGYASGTMNIFEVSRLVSHKINLDFGDEE